VEKFMPDDLQTEFENAAERVQQLSKRPDNETMLELYSLYKQATMGDVSGKRPGFTDFVGRAKYETWAKHKGQSKADAQRAYIALVNDLETA
jgi:diazepam-binding inhibitor (GABA receptor modulating acyl-CoA-binding protein)